MLKLVLNLKEESVSYNTMGVLMSALPAGAPNRIKAVKKDITVKGYCTSEGFLATDLIADGIFALGDKLNLLTMLGIKSIPVVATPTVSGEEDKLIKTVELYSQYDAKWVDCATGEVFKLPEITVIEDVNWGLDAKSRLTMQLKTKLGEFSVIDHRTPAAFQVGCKIKVINGEPKPMMTATIVEGIPTYCPNCNNPLFTFQLDNALPKILKCKAPMCKLMNTKPEDLKRDIEEMNGIIEEPALDVNDNITEDSALSESVDVITNNDDNTPAKKVVIAECEIPESLTDKVTVVEEGAADFILTKSKNSVTKKSRELSKTAGIPLISVSELEEMLNG